MFWVLISSLTLAVIAGLLLALGWIFLPWAPPLDRTTRKANVFVLGSF
jgi:hypothetical protein